MNRDEADRLLAALGAAHDRIAAAMYGIDSHAGLGFLRAGGLSGRTAALWDVLRTDVDIAWAQFAIVSDVLEQSRATRSSRRPSDPQWLEMDRALAAPTIGLDATGLPTGDVPGAAAVRVGDLAQMLEARCGAIVNQLGGVDTSWSAVGSVITPVSEAMNTLTALATDLGAPETVAPLGRRVAVAREDMLSDPLSAAPGGVPGANWRTELANLTAAIATESRRLDTQRRLRDGFPDRIAALSALVDTVAAAERDVADGYARVTEKIADAGLPDVPSAATVLRARVTDLDRLRPAQRWQRLADDVATIEASCERAITRAAELRDAADGLLARRDELRGRLEAYRAKAARNALDEDAELSTLHNAARTLLYTAPCDLPGSTRAVVAYQRALTVRIDAASGRKDGTR